MEHPIVATVFGCGGCLGPTRRSLSGAPAS